METAQLWARRSTCSRLQVGAVFARAGRILVTGYNGAPAGLEHCNHSCDCGFDSSDALPFHDKLCKAEQPCKIAVHAEQNGVAYAARWGISLAGSIMVVTHSPCLSCAMSLVNAGIEAVIFDFPFRDDSGIQLLEKAGIPVFKFDTDLTKEMILWVG